MRKTSQTKYWNARVIHWLQACKSCSMNEISEWGRNCCYLMSMLICSLGKSVNWIIFLSTATASLQYWICLDSIQMAASFVLTLSIAPYFNFNHISTPLNEREYVNAWVNIQRERGDASNVFPLTATAQPVGNSVNLAFLRIEGKGFER